MELLLDSNRGIYIPRDFVRIYKDNISNIDDAEIKAAVVLIDELGKQNWIDEDYWWNWDYLVDNVILDIDGYKYRLVEDGDLFIDTLKN